MICFRVQLPKSICRLVIFALAIEESLGQSPLQNQLTLFKELKAFDGFSACSVGVMPYKSYTVDRLACESLKRQTSNTMKCAGFNYYERNGTCQLFTSDQRLYFAAISTACRYFVNVRVSGLNPPYSVCPSNFKYIDTAKGCYLYVKSRLSWTKAASACQKSVPGGHLVFITSDEEAAAMRQVMIVPAGTLIHGWIGLQFLNPKIASSPFYWKIDANSPVQQAKKFYWNPGQPDNNGGGERCAQIDVNSTWDDTMEYVQLSDGHRMPQIGLGTIQNNWLDDRGIDQTIVDAVKSAVQIGYRHIDTAHMYNTEKSIGVAISELTKQKLVARDDIFITTKLWNNAHRKQDVVPALRKSLANLQLDYVDMYLMHWPVAFQQGENLWPKDEHGNLIFDDTISFTETWEGLIECQKLGLTKSIGVSNFNRRQLQVLFDQSSAKPTNLQVEINPYFSNEILVDFCKQHNIAVTGYSPLGKPARSWKQADDPAVATDPVLTAIGAKRGKTSSQVALRFLIQRGIVVIPKSNSVEHQRENMTVFDFQLTDEEMHEIWKLNRNLRALSLKESYGAAKEYPFNED